VCIELNGNEKRECGRFGALDRVPARPMAMRSLIGGSGLVAWRSSETARQSAIWRNDYGEE
jgi:hypothetical protein